MDRSTPPRPQRRPPQRQSPGPLLAVVGSVAVVFAVLAFATGEWVFLALGILGFLVGLAPIVSGRSR